MSPGRRNKRHIARKVPADTLKDAGHTPPDSTAVPAPATTIPVEAGSLHGPGVLRPAYWQAGLIILFAGLFFVLYVMTACRSVPPGDSGELIAAAWNLGVAHQPGYPTFTILSHIAGLVPVGSPAFRMNLLSAFLDALALGVVGLGILRLLQAKAGNSGGKLEKLVPFIAAIAGASLLAVSNAFWLYSGMAEVFALNNLLSALALVFMLEWARQPARALFLWFGCLFAGLALTNQHTVVLLAPALFTLLIGGLLRRRREMRALSNGKKVRDPGWPLREILIAAGFFIAGLLPYLYLPLAAGMDPAINFGDPGTAGNFWRVVTRGNVGTFSLTADSLQGDRLQQLYFWGRYILHGFTLPGVLLAILGIIHFVRKGWLEGSALALALLFSGPIFAVYANPQLENPLMQGVFERFYILPGLPLAFFIAAGVMLIGDILRYASARLKTEYLSYTLIPIGLVLTVALLAVVAVQRLPSVDMSDNRVVEDYGRDLLGPLEPDSLLIMTNDYNYGSVVYMQNVLGYRTDVVALHVELLKGTSYVNYQKRHYPEIEIPFERYYSTKKSSLVDLVGANLEHRPVYAAGIFDEEFRNSFDEVYWGLSYRFLEKGRGTDPFLLMRPRADLFAGLYYPQQAYPPTTWESLIARQYGLLAFNIALDRQQPEAQPDSAFVERMYRLAILNSPDIKSSYNNLALLLFNNGGDPAEIVALWEKYLQLVPDDPQKAELLSAIDKLKAEY
ncbi:MAG: DUF2723 domain-containing protein [Dehalococcoidales bacterium]|nr:DUF2723 domain-containing protein [Dehalococcoidales bacterium]